MTGLLEFKERLIRICEEYDTYMRMFWKFIVALSVFVVISNNIGYNTRLSSLPVSFVLALVCCLLPQGFTLWITAIVICADMYSLCMEAAIISLILFAILLFIFFRFTEKGLSATLLTPVAFKLGIPYIMPIGTGLLGEAHTVLSVACGTVVYYFLYGVHQNASILANPDSEEELSNFEILINQITSNKEMMLVIAIFVIASLVTYIIRRMDADHSWLIAIVAGGVIQIVGIFAGSLILSLSMNVLPLVLGGIISIFLGIVIMFFFMNLDYARVERVQFEDDDYYYYVKAIPKKIVPEQEKVVKHYGNTASMGRRIERPKKDETDEEVSKKVFAQEMDIDEDLLK